MNISEYINRRYKTGISREHSYRGDLQTLLEAMLKNVLVTNEPARIACGAPDFILTHKDIPVGYIEAKDIGEPLSGKKHSLLKLLQFQKVLLSFMVKMIQNSLVGNSTKQYNEFA